MSSRDHVFYTNVSIVGDQIYLRYVKNGERKARYFPYKPTLYVPTEDHEDADRETIYGEPVKALNVGGIKETKDFVRSHEGIQGFEIYNGDVPFTSQFLNDLFGDEEVEPDNRHIRVFSFDMETTAEYGFPNVFDPQEEIIVLSLHDSYTDKVHVWSTLPHASPESIETEEVREFQDRLVWNQCENEFELLRSFIDFWKTNTPDILTGWNTKLFDMPYFVARGLKILGEHSISKLSPVGRVNEKETSFNGKPAKKVHIQGVSQLDYLDLYKKFTFVQRDNYKLDNIARIELGRGKLEIEGDTFRETYRSDRQQRFVEYNIIDSVVVKELDEELGLIRLAQTLAYMARTNYEDAMSPVKTWDMIIFKYLYQTGKVAPIKQSHQKDELEGAYVMDPEPGFHDWVVSFDVASLYPSVIMGYNMSPETLLTYTPPVAQFVTFEKLKNAEKSLEGAHFNMAANGACFRTDIEGILPHLTRQMFAMRKDEKEKMKDAKKRGDTHQEKYHDTIQMALKVTLNSLYGCTSNIYFRYYLYPIADGITSTGRAITKFGREVLDNFMKEHGLKDYVAYCDTDSVGGDTLVELNGEVKQISEWFDEMPDSYIRKDDFNENWIKVVDGFDTFSVSEELNLERKPVKYIMKHRVKKRMFRLHLEDSTIDVTEDHSIIVKRNNSLEVVKPTEILETDEILEIM